MSRTQYFYDFPISSYYFGDELVTNQFQNISVYADVIDQVKNASSSYIDYYILPGERPDQLSYKLYGDTQFYWTFFLMNDKLREQGWPLSHSKLYDWAVKNYNERVITTKSVLTDKFAVGKTIQGNTSSASGTIIKRDLDLGQVWVEASTNVFQAGEVVVDTADGSKSITVLSTENRINAAHHYEKTAAAVQGDHHDIDPASDRPSTEAVEKTWMDRLTVQNDNLKSIVILRNELVIDIARSFQDAVRL